MSRESRDKVAQHAHYAEKASEMLWQEIANMHNVDCVSS
jgi:hypothetical protein